MEIEKNPQEVSKKLCKLLRIIIYMMKKSLGKSNKLLLDFHMLLKQSKIANKAFTALTCRPNDAHLSFISPREYEFSCSSTLAHRPTKRHQNRNYYRQPADEVQNVLDMLNSYDIFEASSLLPGFGNIPSGIRQLRVTDSPFPLAAEAGDGQVDKDAEEFIDRFYRDLKNQRKALGSPSPNHLWAT